MPIKYELAPDLQVIVNEMALLLFPHVKIDSVVCMRSFGSSSRGTIARCHALGKAMQLALGRKGFYVIEVINKRFDKMSEVDRLKVLIHELMHIPYTFGGGFKHHDYVCRENVEKEYQRYVNLKQNEQKEFDDDEFEREVGKKDEIKEVKKRRWL
jgi:predicted metallopeptidase